MDSFIQVLNNQARCVAKGSSELVNNFLAVTVRGLSIKPLRKKHQIIFSPIYLLHIAEVNYFYHHS